MADRELNLVCTEILEMDPQGERIGTILRQTLDQLYDGQHTGRYRWDQLHKTEKTHCGTLVEINLHREFGFEDGATMDYRIGGVDVDCKYSQSIGGWMIPLEAMGHLCLLKPEGIIILGHYDEHRRIAQSLGVPVPGRGEMVCVRVAPASTTDDQVVELEGSFWRAAMPDDPIIEAPECRHTR